MKKSFKNSIWLVLSLVLLIAACSPVSLSSWKNPNASSKISRIVVMALFDRLNYVQPFEQSFSDYMNSKGLKTIQSLSFLVPFQKYDTAQLKKKMDSLDADAIVVFQYKGADVEQNYNPGTFYGFYGGYRYGYGGAVVAGSPGYWSTTTTLNLRARLYQARNATLLWTGDISITDPTDVNQSAMQIAQNVYNDWVKNQLVSPVK